MCLHLKPICMGKKISLVFNSKVLHTSLNDEYFFFNRKIIDVSPGETVEQQEYNDRAHQYG